MRTCLAFAALALLQLPAPTPAPAPRFEKGLALPVFATEFLVDDATIDASELVAARLSPHRLLYQTAPLPRRCTSAARPR